jgi:GNAT superfamily N-acetyltransferase
MTTRDDPRQERRCAAASEAAPANKFGDGDVAAPGARGKAVGTTGGVASGCGCGCADGSAQPAGLHIRRASTDDAGILCELIRELAAFEHLEAECAITEDAVRAHLLGANRSADALVAWLEDAPVGFAVYYRTFSTFAARPGVFLEDLYVRPRFRRRGIGRALLATVARLAARVDAGRLEWTALKWNENARRLYASLGAHEMTDWLLLRMDSKALADFGCAGPGQPNGGCRCGGEGPHNGSVAPTGAA